MDSIDFTEPDPRSKIARLEIEIEELTRSLERGRKLGLLARLILGGGAIWIVGALLGAFRFDATAILGSIAAIIGGIVLFGSNSSTLEQMKARIEAAEAERAALIGSIGLRVVSESPQLNGNSRWH